MQQQKILIIDDEEVILHALHSHFTQEGFCVESASTFEEGQVLLSLFRFEATLVDLRLSGGEELDGFKIVNFIKERAPWTRIVVMTGYASPEVEREAMRKRVDAFLPKPLSPQNITKVVQQLLNVDESARSNVVHAIKLGRRIREELSAIHFSAYEGLSSEEFIEETRFHLAPPLLKGLAQAQRLLRAVVNIPGGSYEQENTTSTIDDFNFEFDLSMDAQETATEGVPQPDRTVREAKDDTLGAIIQGRGPDADTLRFVCERLISDIQTATERFTQACEKRVKWEIITEGGEALRLVREVLHAAFSMVAQVVDPVHAAELYPEDTSRIHEALAVRNSLFSFRKNILAILPESMDAVTSNEAIALEAMEKIEDLFVRIDYKLLRAHDRYVLRQLHSRLMNTRLAAKNGEEGAHVLSDIRSYADMLLCINQREELVTHDQDVKRRTLVVLEDLERTLQDPPRDGGLGQYCSLLDDLKALSWRDSSLDAYVASELQIGASSERSIPQRVEKLRLLLQAIDI